jgi:hypothetical protein
MQKPQNTVQNVLVSKPSKDFRRGNRDKKQQNIEEKIHFGGCFIPEKEFVFGTTLFLTVCFEKPVEKCSEVMLTCGGRKYACLN